MYLSFVGCAVFAADSRGALIKVFRRIHHMQGQAQALQRLLDCTINLKSTMKSIKIFHSLRLVAALLTHQSCFPPVA